MVNINLYKSTFNNSVFLYFKFNKVGSFVILIVFFFNMIFEKMFLLVAIVSISDMNGNVIAWTSSGTCGFKGARKGTPFAAQTVTESALRKAIDQGIRQVEINVNGPGSGRDMAIRAVQSFRLVITLIRDITPIPHNGCRPKKKRRI